MATVAPPSPLLNEKQAAEFLGINPGTLGVWRCTRRYNGGPRYLKIGRAVRYRLSDLEQFAESRASGGEEQAQ
jgi:predicted DNA-binding transcriptional regulator AlpA